MKLAKKWLEKWKGLEKEKRRRLLLMGAAGAAVLLLCLSVWGEQKPQNTPTEAGEISLEEKLSQVLSQAEGAGAVQVVINYESTPELVPAFESDVQENTSSGGENAQESVSQRKAVATLQESGSSRALIIKENQPPVKGVIVVAEGAGDIGVRLALAQAVTTLLDIQPAQVQVLKMGHGR